MGTGGFMPFPGILMQSETRTDSISYDDNRYTNRASVRSFFYYYLLSFGRKNWAPSETRTHL